MLAVAKARGQALGSDQARRLPWQQSCLPDATLPVGFTAAVSNSLLHHLHEPGVLWESIKQVAAPGCVVVIHDLRRPNGEEELQQLVESYAATCLMDSHNTPGSCKWCKRLLLTAAEKPTGSEGSGKQACCQCKRLA